MASIAWRQGLRALVTRPNEEACVLTQALASRGIGALIEPMMQIHFRDASPELAGFRAVLCTSANGVRALARISGERGIPVFAVGDATAARARAEGFTIVESASGDVGSLIRLVADRLPTRGGPLLHVSGSDVAGDLVGELKIRGFAVERSVLYEARPVAALSSCCRSGAPGRGNRFRPLLFAANGGHLYPPCRGCRDRASLRNGQRPLHQRGRRRRSRRIDLARASDRSAT